MIRNICLLILNELRTNCNCPIKVFLKPLLPTFILGHLKFSAYKPATQNVIAINFTCLHIQLLLLAYSSLFLPETENIPTT